MTAMPPLGSAREFAKLAKRFGIPPYPDPTSLGAPVIPGAPLAPENDEALVSFGWESFATAVAAFYSHRNPVFDNGDAAKTAKRTAAISLVMRDLRALEIPPAEWVRKRISDFQNSSLSELQDRPPVGFVFAHGAVGNCLEADPNLSWLGELSQPRVVLHRTAKATIKMWLERRRRTVTLASTGKVEDVPKVWALWDNVLSLCRAEGRSAQAILDKELARGVYVWGKNLFV